MGSSNFINSSQSVNLTQPTKVSQLNFLLNSFNALSEYGIGYKWNTATVLIKVGDSVKVKIKFRHFCATTSSITIHPYYYKKMTKEILNQTNFIYSAANCEMSQKMSSHIKQHEKTNSEE